MGRRGPARRLRDPIRVQLTEAQSDALLRMFAATGQARAALMREAVEAFLITNGFLEAGPNNERSATQP